MQGLLEDLDLCASFSLCPLGLPASVFAALPPSSHAPVSPPSSWRPLIRPPPSRRVLEVDWLQPPGSCVLLVRCHPLPVCLEELKNAPSPGTSGLRIARRGLRSGAGWSSRAKPDNPSLIFGMIITCDSPPLPLLCVAGQMPSWVPLYLLLDCFHFSLPPSWGTTE